MKKIILIASLLMAGGLWAEEDKELVCVVVTKTLEQDIKNCKKGDILVIKKKRTLDYPLSIATSRACVLDGLFIQHEISDTFVNVTCIYRGSLRKVRYER